MLLAGGLLGYQIEYMLTDPVITDLEDDLNKTKVDFKLVQTELEDLKKDYELLETNYSSLRSEFLELKNESIALAEYEKLLDDYLNISNELSNKDLQLENTNQSYQNLKEMYVALLTEYNLWVLPESITMNVNNLNISIDLDGTRFEHNRPMTGAVTISY
jgi:chromosome segregation ATPase